MIVFNNILYNYKTLLILINYKKWHTILITKKNSMINKKLFIITNYISIYLKRIYTFILLKKTKNNIFYDLNKILKNVYKKNWINK